MEGKRWPSPGDTETFPNRVYLRHHISPRQRHLKQSRWCFTELSDQQNCHNGLRVLHHVVQILLFHYMEETVLDLIPRSQMMAFPLRVSTVA